MKNQWSASSIRASTDSDGWIFWYNWQESSEYVNTLHSCDFVRDTACVFRFRLCTDIPKMISGKNSSFRKHWDFNVTLLHSQINNAGVSMQDDIEHTSLEHFDTIMNTNVRGPFYMTMLATPHLVRTRGKSWDPFSVELCSPGFWAMVEPRDHRTQFNHRISEALLFSAFQESSSTYPAWQPCSRYVAAPFSVALSSLFALFVKLPFLQERNGEVKSRFVPCRVAGARFADVRNVQSCYGSFHKNSGTWWVFCFFASHLELFTTTKTCE